MPFPKVNDWSEEVYNAGTRGAFNPLAHLKQELHRCYPDLRPYDIGLFTEDDLKNVTMMGWVHLDYGMFDYDSAEDFNRAVGLRFGMVHDAHGHVKVGDNYIMICPESYREKIRKARKDALNKQNAAADAAAAYSHPSDPKHREMTEYAREIADKGSSRYRVQASGEPDHGEKPKRGRPPKK